MWAEVMKAQKWLVYSRLSLSSLMPMTACNVLPSASLPHPTSSASVQEVSYCMDH